VEIHTLCNLYATLYRVALRKVKTGEGLHWRPPPCLKVNRLRELNKTNSVLYGYNRNIVVLNSIRKIEVVLRILQSVKPLMSQ
jgi:hypothetical protein